MTHFFTRFTLGIAGSIALGIGATIAFAPVAFYATYGIQLPASPDFLSELRAPGTNLTVLGALILIGAVRSDWIRLSALIGTVVFLAYAAGRLIGIGLDGMPSQGIVTALVIELIVGGACSTVLWRTSTVRRMEVQPALSS